MTERVVITGIGIVAPTADTTEGFFAQCLAGANPAVPIPETWNRFGTLTSEIWAPLPEVSYLPAELSRIEQKQLDPVSKNAVHTAFRAVEAAGIPVRMTNEKRRTYTMEGVESERAGVFVGTGVGGVHTIGESYAHQICVPIAAALDERVGNHLVFPKRFNPFTVPMLMPNAAAANIGIKLGVTGPNLTYALACASGTAAIGHCYRAIKRGELSLGLAGGSEYLFDAYGTIFRGFDAVKTLAHGFQPREAANRPFDENRSGFLFSQGGAALLLLESETHARKRDAVPIAEIAGYAESTDAYSIMMMAENGQQIERMLGKLHQEATVRPDTVDYVNAHGTGTRLNDEVEAALISRVYRKDVMVNSTKALIGHTIGASGAIEAAVLALSIQRGQVHGMPYLDAPMADLHFVRHAAAAPIDTAVSHSFAFGGHNTALLLKRYR